jgi:hypothetical protein
MMMMVVLLLCLRCDMWHEEVRKMMMREQT